MPANRFFFNGPLEQGAVMQLNGPEHHHLSRVMRIAIGEEVEIVNGQGILAIAKVIKISKETTALQLLDLTFVTPFHSKIFLAIPLMRPNKLEWTIEKSVELGADGLWLYAADHSEKLQLSMTQLERLRNLTISALKQSGRLFLPSIELLASLQEVLIYEGTVLFGDTEPNAENLFNCKPTKNMLLITGPERGFSQNELSLLRQKAKGVSLSPHILRAETAPIAGLSVLSLMNRFLA